MEREQAMVALADRQHGTVARRQLLAMGLSGRMIDLRIDTGRLHLLHRGVYAVGRGKVSRRGHWMAAVLACGDEALLSHRSAAALWGLMRSNRLPIEVSAQSGRRRRGIVVHEGRLDRNDRAVVDGIPVTSVARTLFDLAEVVDQQTHERAFEEADRLRLLEIRAVEDVCSRNPGRRALRPVRRLIAAAREPVTTRSPLEDRFVVFCEKQGLPQPVTNATIAGLEVDALWPHEKLIAELDGFSFHHHRAAFERDRARDAVLQAAGYRVIRITHRRLDREPSPLAGQIRHLLSAE
jgi:predicted transcriptional regulator of viral defense system